MPKIFAIILVALLLGVGVVALIETDPGYVLVAYGNYTLETSLWVGLLLLVVFTLLVYVLLRLVYRLLGGRDSLVSWLGTRQAYHASRLTTRGLVSFIEGHWTRARRQLLRGAKHNDAPMLNYLMAARASHRLNDPESVSEYLGSAGDADSSAAAAVALTRAELQLQAEQYQQVLVTLGDIKDNAARCPHALELNYRACLGLEDWDKLQGLLPELKKNGILPAERLRELQAQIHIQQLRKSRSPDSLRATWQHLPAALKQDPQFLHCYVGQLLEQGNQAQAEKVIVRSLKQGWDSGLVRLYGYVESDNLSRQLTQAETWLGSHEDDAQLLLCLGRLSARDKLWGKARDYFESSYRLQHSAEACAELGRLLTGLGEHKVAAAYFREGLLLRESDLPALPMPEKMVPDTQRLGRS